MELQFILEEWNILRRDTTIDLYEDDVDDMYVGTGRNPTMYANFYDILPNLFVQQPAATRVASLNDTYHRF